MHKLPKHILVFRFSAMGDVAMTVPVLRALIQQYPELRVTVVTRKFFEPLFSGLKNVSVFPADLKGKHNGITGLWKLSNELKALNVDAIADLHNVLRTKILKLFFFGKRFVQIDKGRAEKRALVSGQKFEQLKTTHQRYADVFEQLGYRINLSNVVFPEKAKLNARCAEVFWGPNKAIGIAPFAAFKGKEYPLNKMEEVVKELSKDHKILLFGGGEIEKQKLETLAAKFEKVINMAGEFTFSEELEIISNLDLMIAMDSGNAHLAAMFGIPVVTIWGVTHPYAGFYPFNQPESHALLADREQFPDIPTSIYGNKYHEEYLDAIAEITPEQIVAKVHSVLSGK